MRIYTTDIIEPHLKYEYKGFIVSRTVRALSFVKDFFTSFRDFFGGRSKSYEKTISNMHSEVLEDLIKQAKELDANAIIGLRIDFDNIGSKNHSLIMATAKATAIKITNL